MLSGTFIHHAHNYASLDPEFVLHFIKSLQVDDLISGADSLQDFERFYLTCEERLATTNFSLRKFSLNSGSLNYRINNVTRKNNSTKILGCMCNIKHDTLEFNSQGHMLLIQDPPTKRSLVKYFAFLYDPLELLNPYIAKLKIVFQKVCKVGIPKDQTFLQELVCEWDQIFEYTMNCEVVVINRWNANLAHAHKLELYEFLHYTKNEEILNGKLHFLCSVRSFITSIWLLCLHKNREY